MKLFLGCFIGLVLSVSVGAESLLEGRVRLSSGQPAVGVQVRLFDLTDLRRFVGTTTDESGHFALSLRAFSTDRGTALPTDFVLGQNYPNPFNPSTVIPYQIPASDHVRLEVFNLLGQRLATLVDAEQSAGMHTALWDATDAVGRAVGAGVYIYRLSSGGVSVSRRMVLVDGQAGISAVGAIPGPVRSTVEGLAEVDGPVYGLTVSGEGLVAYVNSAFRVGVDEVDIVVEEHGSARLKRAAGGALGDVDGNGQVEVFDVLYILLYSVDSSIVLPNNGDISRGDINGDGMVDMADAVLLLRYLSNPSDLALPPGIGQDPDDTLAGATQVDLGSSTSGSLSVEDVDYFVIEISNSGTLVVSTTGSVDTEGAILDSSGNVLARDSDSGEGFNFRVSIPVSAGTYYIEVEGWGSDTGDYTLNAYVQDLVQVPTLASLLEAIRLGDIDSVRHLVQAGANVNQTDPWGETPLHEAIRKGNAEILQILVDAGADANGRDGAGNSAIHVAVRQDNPEIVRILVDAGTDANERDAVGNPAIQVAIVLNKPDMVQILIDAGVDANETNFIGNPIIHEALIFGNSEIIQILVNAGADVNAFEKGGRFSVGGEMTALARAVRLDYLEIVQILIDAGADVYAKETFGQSALEAAIDKGNPETLLIFLYWAIRENETRIVRVLVAAGVDVDTKDPEGTPVLFRAVSKDSPMIVQILVEAGADVKATDQSGDSPLHWAVRSGSLAGIVRILVEAGADVNAMGRSGDTPLQIAEEIGASEEIVQILTTAGSQGEQGEQDEPITVNPASTYRKIYWADSDKDRIERANLDGSQIETLVNGLGSDGPEGIAIDLGGGKIYWTESDRVRRANLDGSQIETLGTKWGDDIALDLGQGKIYLANNRYNKIYRMGLDGALVETLVDETDEFTSYSIALDLSRGKMYWGLVGIYRANLDGSQIETFLSGVNAYDIDIDEDGGKIYWGGKDGIYRANLDGSQIETLFNVDTRGIAVDLGRGKIYWTESDRVRRANLDRSQVETIVAVFGAFSYLQDIALGP